MTSREYVAETLKGIPEFERRVHFVHRPPKGYPCVIYNVVGEVSIDLTTAVGRPYATWYTIDIRTSLPGDCEKLMEKVLETFRSSPRLERTRDLSFMYEDAEGAQAGTVRDPYGVFRGVRGFLIRETE